jgi:phage protein D
MPVFRPSATITRSGRSLTAAEAAVLRIDVSLGVLGGHDGATLTVWRSSKLADLGRGDPLAIALGERDGEVDVTAGTVSQVAARGSVVEIELLAGTAPLSRSFLSRSYLGQTVADVVRDLAGDADVDQIDAAAELSAYAVDDRRPVWSHLRDLAALVDADLGASPAGALRFVPVATPAPVRLGAQRDLLAWSIGPRSAAESVAIAAYGSASEAGADQWHWLRRAPAASGDGAVRLVHAFHTRQLADQLAQALAARQQRRAVGGTATLGGNPDLRPGGVVQAADAPGGDPGPLRILRVDHVLDASRGFTTTIAVEGTGAGAGAGGLAAAAGGLL